MRLLYYTFYYILHIARMKKIDMPINRPFFRIVQSFYLKRVTFYCTFVNRKSPFYADKSNENARYLQAFLALLK